MSQLWRRKVVRWSRRSAKPSTCPGPYCSPSIGRTTRRVGLSPHGLTPGSCMTTNLAPPEFGALTGIVHFPHGFMHRLPPLNALRVFEVAARTGSYAEAGAELGLTLMAPSAGK